MEVIRELVKVINLKKIKRVNALYAENNQENIFLQLYHTIATDKNNELTEDDLAYEIASVPKDNKKYGMLKSRFIKKALNQVMYVDLSDNLSINAKEIFKANRLAFLARLLYSLGANKTALLLCNKAVPLLEKHELLESLINLQKIKLSNFSTLNKTKKFNQTANDLSDLAIKLYNEINTIIIYQRIGKIYNKAEVLTKIDFNKLKKEIQALAKIDIDKNSTFLSSWYKKTLLIEYYQYLGDYQKVLKELENVNLMFANKEHFFLKSRKLVIQTSELEALGKLNKISKGERLITELNNEHALVDFNWFHVQRKITFFYIDTKQYDIAFKNTEIVINTNDFKTYNENFKELWTLWYTFLKVYHYRFDKEKLKEVKIYKALNSINKTTKDKLGVNTLKVVLELFYNLLTNNFDPIIESYNILSIYKSRYLKPNRLERATIFLDFITSSSRSAFLNETLEENAKSTLNKLGCLNMTEIEKKAYEIIPYEDLIRTIIK